MNLGIIVRIHNPDGTFTEITGEEIDFKFTTEPALESAIIDDLPDILIGGTTPDCGPHCSGPSNNEYHCSCSQCHGKR